MRRLVVPLLAACLLGMSAVPAIAQEPSSPPWFGGRVAMPELGFAVTLPDDWVAFDVTGDLEAQVEAARARLAGLPAGEFAALRKEMAEAEAEGVQLLTIEFSERVIEYAVEPQACGFAVLPDGDRALDEELATFMYQAFRNDESVTDVEPPTSVDLPVGPGWVLAMTAQSPYDPDDWGPAVLYLAAAESGAFIAACTASERPDDDFLSIVETFEFLSEKPPLPPPWFGGRVEMPEHGFAIAFPEDWVAFDAAVDIDAQVAATYEQLGDVLPQEAPVLSAELRRRPWLQLQALSFDSGGWSGSGVGQCGVLVQNFRATLDETVSIVASGMDADDTLYPDGVVVTDLVLPAGRSARLDYTFTDPEQPPTQNSRYMVEQGLRVATVGCSADERPDDRWLSIAETLEFLPAEE